MMMLVQNDDPVKVWAALKQLFAKVRTDHGDREIARGREMPAGSHACVSGASMTPPHSKQAPSSTTGPPS